MGRTLVSQKSRTLSDVLYEIWDESQDLDAREGFEDFLRGKSCNPNIDRLGEIQRLAEKLVSKIRDYEQDRADCLAHEPAEDDEVLMWEDYGFTSRRARR
jgi:hypothetical protein